MREEFLHFVWRNRKFQTTNLKTSEGETLHILNLGQQNGLAGPDFFNAKIELEGQVWAGNVEMHLNSSDWFAHNHERDPKYNNVILHVVWVDDIEVFRMDGSKIPCLVLEPLVPKDLLFEHQQLMQRKKFINCENDFKSIDEFTKNSWLQRLYVERLEQKSNLIFDLLDESKNDWEKVLFCLLMKNFGLNTNGPIFLEIAKKFDFSIFRKLRHDGVKAESLLLGMANLLEATIIDPYHEKLKIEFEFLRNKFSLNPDLLPKPNFYGLRPNNFPTIRLSQLAQLYVKNEALFQSLMQFENSVEIRSLFEISASHYWNSHYVFGKTTSNRIKRLSSSFIDLVFINTIIPLKFCYAKKMGKSTNDTLFALAESLKPEGNSVIQRFNKIDLKTKNSLESQAKLQLYNEYCQKNRCLNCTIGNKLLLRNS